MDQYRIENKNYYYFLIFALILITFFTTKFYLKKKNENHALKLKILTLKQEKRKPKPWSRLLAPATVTILPVSPKNSSRPLPIADESNPSVPLSHLSLQELANLLNEHIGKIKSYALKDLEKTIEVADEILSQDPDTYSAYKAKLIALLIKEAKFKKAIDEGEINSLLEEMATFDLSSDSVMRAESSLMSNAEQEITYQAERINLLTLERVSLEDQLALLNEEDLLFRSLEARRADLLYQEDEANYRMANLQKAIEQDTYLEVEYLNEDVVHIPFLRLMAQNDFTGVILSAEKFIEQFPSSSIGYFYLARALERTGRNEEAIEMLAKSSLSNKEQSLLLEKINLDRTEDPEDYWKRLSF